MDTDNTDVIALLANTLNQAKFRLYGLEQAAGGIGLHVNEDKTEYMCFNQGDISTLNGDSLKSEDKFTYLGSSISSTKCDIKIHLAKSWTTIDRLSTIWKSDQSNKIKRNFFQAAVVSILLYECWQSIIEKKLDRNSAKMLQAISNKSWKWQPIKQQLYSHLLPIFKTIQIRWTRHAGHCWRSKDKLISDILLWTPSHKHARVGWPTRTYIQQLCTDTGCSLEDLPEVMDDRNEWWESSQGNPC